MGRRQTFHCVSKAIPEETVKVHMKHIMENLEPVIVPMIAARRGFIQS